MNKTSRAIVFGFLMVLLCGAFTRSQAQTPYPSLGFARNTDKDGTLYELRPVVEEIHKRIGGADKSFMILGAVVSATNERAALLLVNAQKEFQFDPSDTDVVFTADGKIIQDLNFKIVAKGKTDTPMKIEIANVLISLDDYRTIANAGSVVARFGKVTYELDKENREALRFLLTELDKDNK